MSLKEFKCPSCGGSVSFNVENQNLKCDYCGSDYEIEGEHYHGDSKSHSHGEKKRVVTDEEGTVWEQEENPWDDEDESNLYVYSCQSCGGEIIGDETMGSTSCPYCTNNVVVPSQFAGDLRPDFLVPFKMNKDQAKEALRKFYKGRLLLPEVFKDENHIEEIKGIYVPFWLFSGKSSADIDYTGTILRFYSDSKYDYTETSYYDINRSGSLDFEYVPVDGSEKIDDEVMESIEPFLWDDGMEFNSAYMAGFLADRYDVEPEKLINTARSRIENTTEATFRNSLKGYDTVDLKRADYELNNVKINYALVPVWFLNTKWNGELYTFAMNGQTGKIVGDELPIDRSLYMKRLLIYTLIPAVIIFLILIVLYRIL